MSKKNELKNTEEHLPAAYDFGDDFGKGRENEDGEERAIPQIILIQKSSPQVDRRQAMPGQLFNIATEEVIEPPMTIVPAAQDRWFVHKDKDRNFMGKYRVNDPLIIRLRKEQGKFGKLLLQPELGKDSEYIQETRYLYYVIVHEDGTFSRAVTPFKSSAGLPAWGAWKECLGRYEESCWQLGSLPKGKKLPYPSLLTTLGVKDDSKGNDQWKSFDFNPGLPYEQYSSTIIMPGDARYDAAKALAEAFHEGAVDAVDEGAAPAEEPATEYC